MLSQHMDEKGRYTAGEGASRQKHLWLIQRVCQEVIAGAASDGPIPE